MKYCTHCGAEIEDEAVVCVHCGCATNEQKVKSSNNSNLGKIALVFMIIGCVFTPIMGLVEFAPWLAAAETATFGIILMICSLIPLAWSIPMTIIYSRKYKNGEPISTAFKVCALLFVNLIAGILMLCMPSENN